MSLQKHIHCDIIHNSAFLTIVPPWSMHFTFNFLSFAWRELQQNICKHGLGRLYSAKFLVSFHFYRWRRNFNCQRSGKQEMAFLSQENTQVWFLGSDARCQMSDVKPWSMMDSFRSAFRLHSLRLHFRCHRPERPQVSAAPADFTQKRGGRGLRPSQACNTGCLTLRFPCQIWVPNKPHPNHVGGGASDPTEWQRTAYPLQIGGSAIAR